MHYDLRNTPHPSLVAIPGYQEATAAIAAKREETNQKMAAVGIDPQRVVFNYELVLAQRLMADADKIGKGKTD